MTEPRQLGQAIQNTSDGIVIVDDAGLIRFANQAAEVLFGRSEQELTGCPFGFPMVGGDGEIDVLRPSGNVVQARMRISETDWDGKRANFVYLTDLTAQREVEDELRNERRYNQQLVQLAPALICCVSASGQVRFVNPAFVRQTGYSLADLQGCDFWEVLFLQRQPPFVDDLMHKLQTEPMVQREMAIYPRLEPKVMVSWTWLRRSIGGQEELVGFGTNISTWKEIEQLRNDFISSLSHELRSPLTSLLGALRLVQGQVQGEVSNGSMELIEIALRNAQRLIRLSEDILDLRKIEMGQIEFLFQHLDITKLVESATESIRQIGTPIGVGIKVKAPPSPVWVFADADRLHQVLTNLLINAVMFSPRDKAVEVAVVCSPGLVRVTVSDRGPGIPVELRPHIFERFVRSRVSPTRSKVGTGLGLSIAKTIMDRLSGQIGFETQIDVGTTFFIELATATNQGQTHESST